MTPGDASLGRVVQTQRKRLGLSQTELAARIGRSEAWVSQVERGVRRVDRMSVLERLAESLSVPVGELAEREIVQGPPVPQAVVHASLALSRSPLLGGLLGEAPAEDELARVDMAADTAWAFAHSGEYDALASLLVETLPIVDVATARGSARDRRRVAESACQILLAASAMLSQLDDSAAAWVAADRAARLAELTGDPLKVAAAVFRLGFAFQSARRFDLAESALGSAYVALGAPSAPTSVKAAAMRGALALQLAVVAALRGEGARAYEWLDVARPLAERVGDNRNDYNTEFGRPNLSLHEVAVAVELGDAGRALRVANSVERQSLSPERVSGLLIDVARAHAQLRQIPEAMSALREALTVAPEHVRSHAAVRDLVSGLMGGDYRRDKGVQAMAAEVLEP